MRQTTTAEVRLEQGKPPSSGPAVGQPIVSAAGMEPSRTKLFAAEHKKSDDIPHGTRNPGNVGYVCSLLLCKPIKAMILGRLRIGRLSSAVLEPRNNQVVSVMTEQESASPIFLIQGTWGRGFFPHDPDSPRRKWRFFPDRKKEWYEHGSPFYTKLSTELTKAGLNGSLRPFLWSGANSIKARDDAAEKFFTILTESLREPESKPIIITHSHGGNVALLALSKLQCSGSRVKLITMATPFLRVFPTERLNNPFLILLFIWVLGTIALVCAAAALLLVGLGITTAVSVIFAADITLEHWPIWLWIAGGVVALVVGYFFLDWAYSVFDPGTERRDAIAKAAFYGPGAIPRMLVIRG